MYLLVILKNTYLLHLKQNIFNRYGYTKRRYMIYPCSFFIENYTNQLVVKILFPQYPPCPSL